MKLSQKLFGQSLFYAVTIVLGMTLALSELDQGRTANFLRFSVVVLLAFVIELYLSWTERSRQVKQTQIPRFDRISYQSQLLHHAFLPVIAYLSILGFAYFNRQFHLRVTILGLAFVVFTILFINIRAYYAHTLKVLESTHFIYDIIKLVIFFCACDTLLNISITYNLGILGILGIAFLSIGLLLLMLIRYNRLELLALLLVIALSAIIGGLTFFMLSQGRFNAMQMAFISFLSFYVSSAALHHEMDHDLTWTILLEYVAILIIAISLVYGING